MQRSVPLETGEIYHIMNKSIAGYKIFPSPYDYERMQGLLRYYTTAKALPKFSYFLRSSLVKKLGLHGAITDITKGSDQCLQVIAYSLMPTHIHLVVKQLQDNGVSFYVSNILNGYARFFNSK
jgi:putative transposase